MKPVSSCEESGKILILATETCAYPGANAVGQAHSSYPANSFILRVRSPVMFPEKFYMDCFEKGIGGVIIMTCGEECPYPGAYHALAKRIDRVYQTMKSRGLDLRRLRLTAICTVCHQGLSQGGQRYERIIAGTGVTHT